MPCRACSVPGFTCSAQETSSYSASSAFQRTAHSGLGRRREWTRESRCHLCHQRAPLGDGVAPSQHRAGGTIPVNPNLSCHRIWPIGDHGLQLPLAVLPSWAYHRPARQHCPHRTLLLPADPLHSPATEHLLATQATRIPLVHEGSLWSNLQEGMQHLPPEVEAVSPPGPQEDMEAQGG